MKCVAGGILAGLLFGAAAIVGGTDFAAGLAIALALVAIAIGCVDYVKHHGWHG